MPEVPDFKMVQSRGLEAKRHIAGDKRPLQQGQQGQALFHRDHQLPHHLPGGGGRRGRTEERLRRPDQAASVRLSAALGFREARPGSAAGEALGPEGLGVLCDFAFQSLL